MLLRILKRTAIGGFIGAPAWTRLGRGYASSSVYERSLPFIVPVLELAGWCIFSGSDGGVLGEWFECDGKMSLSVSWFMASSDCRLRLRKTSRVISASLARVPIEDCKVFLFKRAERRRGGGDSRGKSDSMWPLRMLRRVC